MGIFRNLRFGGDVKEIVQPSSAILDDGTRINITREINAIGSVCPGPQLKVMKAMGESSPGDVVSVHIDTPMALETVVPMCGQIGATHLGTVQNNRSWCVFLQKDE